MKRTYLFLVINLVLWVETLQRLVRVLSAPDTPFDRGFNGAVSDLSKWFGMQWFQVRHFILSWQSLLLLIVFLALVVLVIKLWRLTFIFLTVVSVLTAFWIAFYVSKGQFVLTDYYPLVILVISLGNIWLSAKASNL